MCTCMHLHVNNTHRLNGHFPADPVLARCPLLTGTLMDDWCTISVWPDALPNTNTHSTSSFPSLQLSSRLVTEFKSEYAVGF